MVPCHVFESSLFIPPFALKGAECEMPRIEASLQSENVTRILDIRPEDAIRLALRTGKRLKAAKVGKCWRYYLTDVMAYKKAQETSR